jgi:Flp pilus assembly protein TadG
MHSHSFKPGQVQRGVAMVEFAITLPLLLLLLLAFAEFGRMLYHYNNLLQANRDAVRYVAKAAWDNDLGMFEIDPAVEADRKNLEVTKNLAVYGVPTLQPGNEVVPGLTTDNVTVSVSAVNPDHVRVTTRYVFQPVIGNGLPALIGDAIPLNFPLVATTVMRGL